MRKGGGGDFLDLEADEARNAAGEDRREHVASFLWPQKKIDEKHMILTTVKYTRGNRQRNVGTGRAMGKNRR